MRVSRIASFALILGISSASTVAFADRQWSSIGGGCVPTDEAINLNNYNAGGFGVTFNGTAPSTSVIRLLCPVTVRATGAAPALSGITMSYKDTDGTGTAADVKAIFKRVADGSNSSVNLCTVDSASGLNITTPQSLSCAFAPGFNASLTDSYFVEVTISRLLGGGQFPEFLAISLH